MVEVLALHLLLVGLTVVEVVEVGHDDRDGQGNGEHTGDGAQGTHDLAPHTHGPGGGRGGRDEMRGEMLRSGRHGKVYLLHKEKLISNRESDGERVCEGDTEYERKEHESEND